MTLRRLLLLVLWMALSWMIAGCAVPPPLKPAAPLALVPAQSLWQLDVQTPQGQESMLLEVQSGVDLIQLVGVTPLGQKTMHLRYSVAAGMDVIVRPPLRIDAGALLTAVQLALWPEPALRELLQPGQTLETTDTARDLKRNGALAASVSDTGAGKAGRRIVVTFADPALRVTMLLLDAP